MIECSDGHENIAYEGKLYSCCPLCEALFKAEKAKDDLQDLKDGLKETLREIYLGLQNY
ncbi:MAG: hypothetical protein KJ725_20350 [Gammaproteobacteria bacterium]|nr:hypothetical protein [Gammaproteobacteria bacterium]